VGVATMKNQETRMEDMNRVPPGSAVRVADLHSPAAAALALM
jgi:hypothetical protein